MCAIGPARLLSFPFSFGFLFPRLFISFSIGCCTDCDTDDSWAMSPLSCTIYSGLVKILLDEMQLWEEWSDSVAVVVENHLESFVCWGERKIQVGRKCGISVDHILRAFPVKILLFLCFYFYHLLCQKAIPQQCPHTFIASFSFFLLLLESSKYEKT